MNKVLFSSNSDEWTTPLDLFNRLDNIFSFDIDLCASDTNHLCKLYFTKNNSCLDKDLFDHVIYYNPPYFRNMYIFIKKCFELSKNNIVVMLLPSRTDTKWFHDFILPYCDIIFIKGRLKFGGSKNSAPFPSIICCFRSN